MTVTAHPNKHHPGGVAKGIDARLTLAPFVNIRLALMRGGALVLLDERQGDQTEEATSR